MANSTKMKAMLFCLICGSFWGASATPLAGGDPPQLQPERHAARVLQSTRMLHYFQEVAQLKQQIPTVRRQAWLWQKTEPAPTTPTEYLERRVVSVKVLHWQLRLWQHRLAAAKRAVGPGVLPYRHFGSCLGAVNYLFGGRWDHQRAVMVVGRESHFYPDAANGSHLGCAQESDGMRSTYLKGPWNDPYWNVRAMLAVVQNGGWCNWDLYNYCGPGGEF